MTAAEHARMQSGKRRWLTGLEMAAIGVTGAVILAPYLLPAIGIGNVDLAEETMTALHSTTAGTGIAGLVAKGLNAIPLIGPSLAAGGWWTTAASGVIGIGGSLAGNALAEKARTPNGMRWCRLITIAALATSSLISLPALLTGISAGVVFLSAVLFGLKSDLASSVVTFMAGNVGSVGTATVATAGAGGAIATATRLLTCCMPALPTGYLLASHARHTSPVAASPIALQVTLASEPVGGIPCQGRLLMTDAATGRPVSADQLELRHEHKLHLMIVDDGVEDYHHLHPEPTSTTGEYSFTFTPGKEADYHFWIDATRAGETHPSVAHAVVAASHPSSHKASFTPGKIATAGGLTFHWSASPPLREGQDSVIALTVTDASGRPVTDLEPVMGAAAHLVGFGEGASTMMHLHPLAGNAASPLHFHVHADKSGPTTFFLQVARQGQCITAPFRDSIFPAKARFNDVSEAKSFSR